MRKLTAPDCVYSKYTTHHFMPPPTCKLLKSVRSISSC